MGAYTCEYGVVHKRCRCIAEHFIRCDVPSEHKDLEYIPKHRKDVEEKKSEESVFYDGQ